MSSNPDDNNKLYFPDDSNKDKDELILKLQTQNQELEKRIQKQTKKLEHLGAISDLMPGAFFEFVADKDDQFQMTYISHGAEKVFNKSFADLKNPEKMLEDIHSDDIEEFISSIKFSETNLSLWDHIYRVKSNIDDSYIWIHGKSNPEKREDGATVWRGLLLDITEQKKAEAELVEQKEKYEVLIDKMLDGYAKHKIVCDENGIPIDYITLEINKAYEYLLNSKKEDIIGKKASEVLPKPELSKWLKIFGPVALNGETKKYTIFSERNKKYFEGTTYSSQTGYFDVVFVDVSERTKFEKALISSKEDAEESEKVFHDLFNNLNSGVAIYEVIDNGKDFIFKYFNDAAERIDRQERKDVIGKSIFEVRPDIEDFGLIQTFRKVVKSKKPIHHPIKIYDDGLIGGYYENYVFLLPSGELVAVFDDTTEQAKFENDLKLAKEKALESELRYKKAQEVGHIGSWEYDIQNDSFWGSEEGKRLYNLDLTREDFPAQEVMDCVVEGDREFVNQALVDLLTEDKPYDIVFTIIPQGTTERRVIHSLAELEKDENGNSIKVTGVLHDITKQKQTEEELIRAKEKAEESDFRLKLAVNSGKLGIWDWDVKSNTMIWDSRMFQLYGITKNSFSVNFDSWLNSVHPDDRHRAINESNSALKGEKDYNTTFRVVKPDNTTLYLKADAIVLRDDKNNPLRMIGINRDITELVEYENELIKARDKAEMADRLKTAFLANMSHEIRTPMNGILGFAYLLNEPGLTGEEQKKYIQIVQKSGERLLSTVNDIIEISRIETGQVHISLKTVNIKQHILTLYDFFSLEANKKGLELQLDRNLQNLELSIKTDINKLSSILTNLLKNAIKYTKNGTIKIGCTQKGDTLEFYVRDTGIGIPEKRKKAIFNRFEQADVDDKRALEGSGLGLSIAKSYVEMLGGEIWVESEVNKGSTFYFTIFYDDSDSKENNPEIPKLPKQEEKLKIKALIAEDDKVSKEYLAFVLQDITREQLHVGTGIDAVNAVKKNPDIEVVLMDIKMPEMNGLEATKKIREFNKNVVIIAQTAFALEGDREKAIEAGCNDYLSKPIDKRELMSMIRKSVK